MVVKTIYKEEDNFSNKHNVLERKQTIVVTACYLRHSRKFRFYGDHWGFIPVIVDRTDAAVLSVSLCVYNAIFPCWRRIEALEAKIR